MRLAPRLSLLLLASLLTTQVHAAAGRVIFVVGSATVQRGETEMPLVRGQSIESADILRTGPTSYLQVRMQDRGLILLRPSTELALTQYEAPPEPATVATSGGDAAAGQGGGGQVLMSLVRGGFRTITGFIGQKDASRYKVTTPAATIGIRGTHYTAVLCAQDCGGADDGLHVAVSDGGVVVSNQAGQLELRDDQYAFVGSAQQPPQQRLRKPDIVTVDVPPPAEDEDEPTQDADSGGDEPRPQERREEAREDRRDGDDRPEDAGVGFQQPQQKSQLTPVRFGAVAFAASPGKSPVTGVGLPTVEQVRADDAGRLLAFASRSSQGPVGFAIGSAQHREADGFDPATRLRWGRWAGGTARMVVDGVEQPFDLSQQSLHWIYAPTLADGLPREGQASYQLVGNTSPTDNNGNVGFLGSAKLTADFTNQTVHSDLALSVNQQVWNASGSGALSATNPMFHGQYDVVAVDNVSGGSGNFAGFFTGGSSAVPPGAGLTYSLTHDACGGCTVSGSAAFGSPSATGQ